MNHEPLRHQMVKAKAAELTRLACEGKIIICGTPQEHLERAAIARRQGHLRWAWQSLENARACRFYCAEYAPQRAQRLNDVNRDLVLARLKAKREASPRWRRRFFGRNKPEICEVGSWFSTYIAYGESDDLRDDEIERIDFFMALVRKGRSGHWAVGDISNEFGWCDATKARGELIEITFVPMP